MKKRLQVSQKPIVFWLGLILLSGVYVLLMLQTEGNCPETFNDIIYGWDAVKGTNKSIEVALLRRLILVGGILAFLYGLFVNRIEQKHSWQLSKRESERETLSFYLCAICIVFGVYYFVCQSIDPLLIAALLTAAFLLLIDKDLIPTALCLLFSAYYAAFAIYRGYVFLGGEDPINNMTLTVIALLLTILLLISKARRTLILKATMLCQIPIPLLLLVFFQSKYKTYDGQIKIVETPKGANIFVALLILILFIVAVYNLAKHWNNVEGGGKLSEAISIGTCIAIMSFNRFSGTGVIMLPDLHHPFKTLSAFLKSFKWDSSLSQNIYPYLECIR